MICVIKDEIVDVLEMIDFREEVLKIGGLLFLFVMFIVIVVKLVRVGFLLLIIFIVMIYLLIIFWFRILVVVISFVVKFMLNVLLWLLGWIDFMEYVNCLKGLMFEVVIVKIEVKVVEFFVIFVM